MSRFTLIFLCWLCSYQSFCRIPIEAESSEYSNATSTSNRYDENFFQEVDQQLKHISLALEKQRLFNEILLEKLQNQIVSPKLSARTVQRPHQYASCQEALEFNNKTEGVFQILIPDSSLDPFFVSCLRKSETNEVWMIIQRRMNGNINFYKKWHDYKYGFGDIRGEYWLGLERIHVLTNLRPHKLWIELGDFNYMNHSAHYDMFVIGNEDTKYALSVLGEYSGIAGDSLSYHAGQKFSTRDSINDISPDTDCAISFKSAWWFCNCHQCDLNGEYLKGNYSEKKLGLGIIWSSLYGNHYSLKYAHMAIRPVDP